MSVSGHLWSNTDWSQRISPESFILPGAETNPLQSSDAKKGAIGANIIIWTANALSNWGLWANIAGTAFWKNAESLNIFVVLEILYFI